MVNTQVEVEDDEQNNSSDSEVLNENVGMDIGSQSSRASNTNTNMRIVGTPQRKFWPDFIINKPIN